MSDNNVSGKNGFYENPNAQSEKKKSLQAAIRQIEKTYGKGSIMRLGEKPASSNVKVISTGSLGLDRATGIGGIPTGRIIEIFGPESSGKTTLCLHIIAQAQKMGGIAAFIDAEHAIDMTYAKKLGVNTDELLISQPDSGEQALEITETLVRSAAIDLIVIDSVAALVPKHELEGNMGDATMGGQARLMSQALRKLTAAVSKTNASIIFINQIRMKIPVGYTVGNLETTTGGNALKFYTSLRLDIRKGEIIKNGKEIIGHRMKVKVVKNKLAAPFKRAEFDFLFEEGISRTGEIIDIAIEEGIIQKAGSWYSYNGNRLGQGKEKIKEYLKDNPKLLDELDEKLRQASQPASEDASQKPVGQKTD